MLCVSTSSTCTEGMEVYAAGISGKRMDKLLPVIRSKDICGRYGWVRRRLRLILWKQWKRPWTRRKRLIEAGLSEERAVMSAFNCRGSWWNSGASHMNDAFRKKFFDRCGLVSMVDTLHKFRTV